MNIFKTSSWIACSLAAALVAAPCGAGAAGQATEARKAGATPKPDTTPAAGSKAPAPTVMYMLVPVQVATLDPAMKSGCWARVYANTNYSGDTLTLSGPLSIADMDGPYGLNWDDKVKSIELGPKATLTVFDNEAFRDQVTQFKPGQKVADVSKRLGFFDEFASVKLSCGKT